MRILVKHERGIYQANSILMMRDIGIIMTIRLKIPPSHYLNRYWLITNRAPQYSCHKKQQNKSQSESKYFHSMKCFFIIPGLPQSCSRVRHRSLPWRHNGCDGVSNHQHRDCLLNRLFRRRSRKTLELHVTGLFMGNSPVTGEFPTHMTSNAENVSIWWRHHVRHAECTCIHYTYRERFTAIIRGLKYKMLGSVLLVYD